MSLTRRVATYDFETCEQDSDQPGFERPVRVIFHGETCVTFRNNADVEVLPWRDRHVAPGGLTDTFMRWVLGDNPGTGIDRHRRYMADKYHLFGQHHSSFDANFVLEWLQRHRAWYAFEIHAFQSQIARLDIWPRNATKAVGHWAFFQGPPPLQADGSVPDVYDPAKHKRIEAVRRTLRTLSVEAAMTTNSLPAHERALLDPTTRARIDAVQHTLDTLDAQAAHALDALTPTERVLLYQRLHPKRKTP